MRALVVDDSLTVRNALRRTLRDLGFEVTAVADGRQALDSLAQQGKPDVVLLDWEIPVLDGLSLVRLLRQDERYRDLRVLMVTVQAAPESIAAARAAGVDAYLVKPFTPQAIADKLAELHLASPAPRTDDGSAPPLRVLLVDDSAVVRRVLTSALADDPDVVVVDTAADGRIALEKLPEARPDVVILDLEMPNLGGVDTLKALRQTHPRLPVLIFSSLAAPGAAATVEALLAGADDYILKPDLGGDFEAVKRGLRATVLPRVKLLGKRAPPARRATPTPMPAEPLTLSGRPARRKRVDLVVLTSSTGGPNALAAVLPAFAPACPVPIVVVQHMPPLFTSYLATRLGSLCGLGGREAADDESPLSGYIYVAPGGRHLTVARDGPRIVFRTNQDPPVNACRPAADVFLAAAAAVYGPGALAVVLTGMGQDGLEGCRLLRSAGGEVLVQDEASSVVWGMPGHVARAGLATEVLPLADLGAAIARRLERR